MKSPDGCGGADSRCHNIEHVNCGSTIVLPECHVPLILAGKFGRLADQPVSRQIKIHQYYVIPIIYFVLT